MSERGLAVALRDIILAGPSKTVCVPMIVGPFNTSKTTIIEPFDELFGHAQVMHKPAQDSSMDPATLPRGSGFSPGMNAAQWITLRLGVASQPPFLPLPF